MYNIAAHIKKILGIKSPTETLLTFFNKSNINFNKVMEDIFMDYIPGLYNFIDEDEKLLEGTELRFLVVTKNKRTKDIIFYYSPFKYLQVNKNNINLSAGCLMYENFTPEIINEVYKNGYRTDEQVKEIIDEVKDNIHAYLGQIEVIQLYSRADILRYKMFYDLIEYKWNPPQAEKYLKNFVKFKKN